MIVQIDTTIAAAMRSAGIDPVAVVADAQVPGDSGYFSDALEAILERHLECLFIDNIKGVKTIYGGSIDLSPRPKRGRADVMFNGPWDDFEDFSTPRIDGFIPAQINGIGTFDETRVIDLLGKPASALADVIEGADFTPVADRIIRGIRNHDYRHEGGGLIYRIDLAHSWETIPASTA